MYETSDIYTNCWWSQKNGHLKWKPQGSVTILTVYITTLEDASGNRGKFCSSPPPCLRNNWDNFFGHFYSQHTVNLSGFHIPHKGGIRSVLVSPRLSYSIRW